MNKKPIDILSILRSEEGYLLIIVTMIGLILAIIFGYILPDLHYGQMKRAMNNLNELRAYEVARKGINAVRLGMKDIDNFQELIGYTISGVNTGSKKFYINGKYAHIFTSGVTLEVYYSSGNDRPYGVNSSTNSGTSTEIIVDDSILSGVTSGVICRNRGILWAIDQLSGTSTSPRYDEYVDESGNTRFVSGCQWIDLDGKEDGKLDIMIFVSRNGVINESSNGNPKDDGWYFYNSGVTGPDGRPWISVDNLSGTTDIFEYRDGLIRYYDFDKKETLNGSNYTTNTDVKYQRSGVTWYLSMGNNGAWRGKYSGTELWNYQKEFSSGTKPFQGIDNDGDGDVDNNDKVEVFIIVRSTGITVAPDTGYDTDKTKVKLVNKANPNLPNPMRQVLEAGFYISEKTD